MPVQVGEHIEDDDGRWVSVRRDEDELFLCDGTDELTICADAIPALTVALLKRCDPGDVRDMAMEMGFDLSMLVGEGPVADWLKGLDLMDGRDWRKRAGVE